MFWATQSLKLLSSGFTCCAVWALPRKTASRRTFVRLSEYASKSRAAGVLPLKFGTRWLEVEEAEVGIASAFRPYRCFAFGVHHSDDSVN